MKTNKRINSKRPSLWKSKLTKVIRALYPSGHVEFYDSCRGEWLCSGYSRTNPKTVIQDLKTGHTFLRYL